MTILSDSEITELCVLGDMKFDHDKYIERVGNAPTIELARLDKIVEECTIPVTEEDRATFKPMIFPFWPSQIRVQGGSPYPEKLQHDQQSQKMIDPGRRVISYGQSSYGYDVTLADEFKIFSNINSTLIDPKRLDERCLVDGEVHQDPDGARFVILPPNGYLLGRTIEYMRMPNDVMAIALGKSTYARAGAIVNVTPIEPGWEGNVVIEISNPTQLPMKIYANEGISQFVFFRGTRPASVTYADRNGKYQGQTGITLPKV